MGAEGVEPGDPDEQVAQDQRGPWLPEDGSWPTVLLLTTTGARTGRPATVPLGFAVDDGGRVFVLASKAGAPGHPAWFHNLRANPSVMVELGDRCFQARAVVTEGEERDRLYAMVSDGTSEYEKNTDRVFPVVVLDGVPASA
jgi:deazaflavin-dependent oxidoreductase (nitroreductase family)